MLRYIPDFILHHYENSTLQGSFTGFVLLFDIADFTSISSTLQKEGKQGAEELSHYLDLVFGTPIKLVAENNGFISLFAGDAFCAIFPDSDGKSIEAAVNAMAAFFLENHSYHCPLGDFSIKIRIAVSYGEVQWQIFTNPIQNEYVFYGNPLQELETIAATKQDIAYTEAAIVQISAEAKTPQSQNQQAENPYPHQQITADSFIQRNLRDSAPENEIRSAAFCFANLEGIQPENRKQAIATIAELALTYGGYVNKLDATDKGLVAILLFGLPHSEGKTLERICNFSLELVATVKEIAMSISCGSVFAGICGSAGTKEYTAFGHPLNLAARLMSKARLGEVLTDTYVWQELHSQYDFNYLGMLNLKGIDLPIRYYQLAAKRSELQAHQETRFVGRESELQQLRTIIDTCLQDSSNAIVYVSGDAGIGKSRLVGEALTSYRTMGYNVFKLGCDAIIPTPLEPIKQLIRAAFFYNPMLPKEAGLAMFRALWMGMAAGDAELIRIEALIAYLLGYEWPDSVLSYISPQDRPKQLMNAFASLMAKLCSTKPVLLHLDDGQWLDEDSKIWLQAVSKKEIKPLLIISPCRFLEDGTRVDLQLGKHKQYDLELGSLTDNGTMELIKSILRLPNIPADTFSLIVQRSMGNPLFIEQLSSYLMENGNIDAKGNLQGEIGYLSSFSISDIISSRIDRLADNVRECIFNASVLGLEFNIKVLSQMLNSEMTTELESGTKNRIWNDLDELNYIFSHILIKDIVYQRMLSNKLIQLHKAAAEAMEHVYKDKTDEQAQFIAYHFEKAKIPDQAAKYYLRAGYHFTQKYDFKQAEGFLNKALALNEEKFGKDAVECIDVLRLFSQLYLRQNNSQQAEKFILRTLQIAKTIYGEIHQSTAALMVEHGYVLCLLWRLNEAELILIKAKDILAETVGTDNPGYANALEKLSSLYYVRNKTDQFDALAKERLVYTAKTFGVESYEYAMLTSNLAWIYCHLEMKKESEEMQTTALALIDNVVVEDSEKKANIFYSFSKMFNWQQNYEKAEEMSLKACCLYEEAKGVGHPSLTEVYNQLGGIYRGQNKFTESEQYYRQAISIAEKVWGAESYQVAQYMLSLGVTYSGSGEANKAEQTYLKAHDMFTNTVGERNISTMGSGNCLSHFYLKHNDLTKALSYALKLWDGSKAILGNEHFQTVEATRLLAEIYEKMGNTEMMEHYKAMLPAQKE